MGTLTNYFEKDAYKPTYQIGDRVFGYWNNIPFIGSVGNDTNKIGSELPRITVTPDLPIVIDKKLHYVIIVAHKDIKRLVQF
jgi:hypothetical protein